MEETKMENKVTGAEGVRWDLSVFYSGLDDPKIQSDLADYEKKAEQFRTAYKGQLSEKLGSAIADYASLRVLSGNIQTYLYLRQSTDTGDAEVKAKIAETDRKISAADGEYLTFFYLELVAVPDEVLNKLYTSDETVKKHKPWIEHARVSRPHLLSEPVESALTKRSTFTDGAWSEFFDELETDLRFDFGNGEKTLVEMLDILTSSKDASVRAGALQTINSGLGGAFAKYSAQTLYVVAGLRSVEDKERNYKNPMDSRNKSNRVPDAVVEALHLAVEKTAGPLAERWYRLKAAHLGQKTLNWSDRNAPMPFADTGVVPFKQAVVMVLSAYESFSPTLAKIIRKMIAEKRLDAPVAKGRRGGAYNYSTMLADGSPASFTFLNYLGSNNDVMTLAHELGHAAHGMLAGEAQGALMQHAPTAYAETASVFGEMTTYNFLRDRLLKAGEKKALLALTAEKLDSIMNTMVRQISFSNFERRVHGMDANFKEWGEPKKFSVEELDKIWLEVTRQFYGKDGDVFTYENTEHLWAYISHFHRPFYVYGYAFGELLTQSLYAEREKFGDRFEPLYLDLLRSGSTKGVVELLAPFGLDPRDEKFWTRGIEVSLGRMVLEAEALTSELGISSSDL